MPVRQKKELIAKEVRGVLATPKGISDEGELSVV